MNNYLKLSEKHEFDIILGDVELFGNGAVGSLKLSPDAITFMVICPNVNFEDFQQNRNSKINGLIKVIHCETINHKKVTLFNARLIGQKGSLGFEENKYYTKLEFIAQYCILGHHFKSIDSIKIEYIDLEQKSIRQWLGLTIVEYSTDEEHNNIYKVPNSKEVFAYEIKDFAKIDFSYNTQIGFNAYNDDSYKISYYVGYFLEKGGSFIEFLEHIADWEILFALFDGQAEDIDAINFKIKYTDRNYCNFYKTTKKAYPQTLHYLEIPLPHDKILPFAEDIFKKWYSRDDILKRASVLFYDAILKTQSTEQSFLSIIKAVEGFADKYNESFFNQETFKMDVLPEIKKTLVAKLEEADNKDIKSFVKALPQTNKLKYNLENRLNKLIEENELGFLNCNKKLISHIVSYRNTLSHNGGEIRYKKIDPNILHEAYMKLIVLAYILFLKYLELPKELIEYAVNRNKNILILQDNNLLEVTS